MTLPHPPLIPGFISGARKCERWNGVPRFAKPSRKKREIKLVALWRSIRWGGGSPFASPSPSLFSDRQQLLGTRIIAGRYILRMPTTSLVGYSQGDEPLTPNSEISGCDIDRMNRNDATALTPPRATRSRAKKVPENKPKVPYTCLSCDRCYVDKRKVCVTLFEQTTDTSSVPKPKIVDEQNFRLVRTAPERVCIVRSSGRTSPLERPKEVK